MQASGRKVFGWGVEDPNGISTLLELGVDGVVSDFPDVVKGILEGGGALEDLTETRNEASLSLRGLIGERCALDSSRSLGMTACDITRAARFRIDLQLWRRRGFECPKMFLRV